MDAQLAPPTGPTLCSFLIQIGTPGQVSFTCRRTLFMRFSHQSTRACVSGISVERCAMRSCRPKKARSHTVSYMVSSLHLERKGSVVAYDRSVWR